MKKLLILSIFFCLAVACNKDIEVQQDNIADITDIAQNDYSVEIILQERSPDLPTVPYKPVPETRAAAASATAEDFIGRGYHLGNTIIGNDANASDKPIIDITKIRNSTTDRSLLNTTPIRSTGVEVMGVNSWDRYQETNHYEMVFKSGFSFNFLGWKLGRQSTYKKTFSSTNIAENQEVYGEIGIEFRYDRHTMQNSEVSRKLIASKYTDNVFLLSMYNSSISDLRADYGDFMITGYYSGGRATALYLGRYTGTESSTTRERDMNEQLNSSFKLGGTDLSTANLEFGYKKGGSVSTNNKVTQLYCSIDAIGGNVGYAPDPTAKSIEANNVNLNAWLSSLSNANTHTLIGFANHGLYPLSDYILEENFALRLSDYYQDFIEEYPMMLIPFIEVVKVYVRTVNNERLYDVVPVINTRHTDKFIIASTPSSQKSDAELRSYNDLANFTARAEQIRQEVAPYFQGLEVKAFPNVIINPILRDPLVYDFSGLNLAGMYRLEDADTGRVFLYDMSKRIAFTYYKDPFILLNYGLFGWGMSLPTLPGVEMQSIVNNFQIYGL